MINATGADRGRWREKTENTDLDLVYRKILPHTHPRSISKRQQVFIPLNLRPSPFFITIQIQPPVRVKLIRVLSPQDLGPVDANDGDADRGALGDEDPVDELSRGDVDGVGQLEGVVDIGLRKWKMNSRKFEIESVQDTSAHLPGQLGHAGVCPEYLRDERVEVGKRVHELGVFIFAERAAKFSTKGFLHVLVAGEFDKGPLCVTSSETSE